MLAWVRNLLKNWVARVFFGALVVVFVFWGISNVLTLVGADTAVAHVAGKPIDVSVVQAEYQRELAQAGATPDAATRRQVAQSALATVLRRAALTAAEDSLGIVAPDSAVKARLYAIPAFQSNGVFDKAKFTQLLAQNNLSPDLFIAGMKSDIANQELIQALTAGAAAPRPLAEQIFDFIAQARIAETVTVQTSAQTAPAAPDDEVLRHYWKNHPDQFSAPEYRTIKLVILSPAVLAASEPVSDAEIAAAYAQTAAQETVVANRSVRIITVGDAAKATQLAAIWQAGADWPAMQAAAAKIGAAAVSFDHAKADQFPDPALGAAIFAAPPNTITGPVHGPLASYVFDVTDAQAAGAPSLVAVSGQLKQELQLQKAQAQVNQDVDNVQDALAGQTPLDKLPGNLDLTAVEGTLDANGNAMDGTPAPIPGGQKLKDAVVKAVFAAHQGDPANLVTGPDGSYFAFSLDSIAPPATKPYDSVKTQVAAAWTADAQSRAAQAKAAALLQAVNTGQTLDAAAAAAGDPVAMSAPVTRAAPPAGLPQELVPILFTLKPGQGTMLPVSGFLVAVLAKINQPAMADDPTDAAGVTQSLTKSLQNDVTESFLSGLQTREHITVDQKIFAQIAQ